MGMVLPPPKPAPTVGKRQILFAEDSVAADSRAVVESVEKETTRPDTGPVSRRIGSVVVLPDYPEEKTR